VQPFLDCFNHARNFAPAASPGNPMNLNASGTLNATQSPHPQALGTTCCTKKPEACKNRLFQGKNQSLLK